MEWFLSLDTLWSLNSYIKNKTPFKKVVNINIGVKGVEVSNPDKASNDRKTENERKVVNIRKKNYRFLIK